MFRFIHTADIHLDSPLKSLALRDPEIAEIVGVATRRTFEKIIDLCIDEEVDALLIAGDLYDGELRSMKTAAFLTRQFRRLEEAAIPIFLIKGNHDAESSITKHLQLPANVHLFTGSGGVVELKECGVAIHGASFAKREAPKSLLPKYRPPIDGLINIGMMHTSLSGAEGHDDYAPCPLGDLIAHGYDYWALGHIHKRQVYSGDPAVVMAGIPQGRDIGEAGSKSVTLVEITEKGAAVEERFVADTEFRKVEVELTGVEEWQEAHKLLEKALEKERGEAKAQYLICRLLLSGRTPLFWRLRRDSDLFEAEAKESAKRDGKLFIEKIDIRLEPLASAEAEADPVEELERLMESVCRESYFRSEAGRFLETAIGKIPAPLRDRYGKDDAAREAALEQLLTDGIADVIASLSEK